MDNKMTLQEALIASGLANPICPYCKEQSKLLTGEALYPHLPNLAHKYFYSCNPCDAYVGCHQYTKKAYGTLANAELRKARNQAHAAFDPIWQNGAMNRGTAYKMLANELKINVNDCHIGMFDLQTCALVVSIIERKHNEGI